MPAPAQEPVVIFLPVTRAPDDPDGVVVDPVCGRALAGPAVVGRLSHDGRHHHFCSLHCAGRFAARPAQFIPG